MAVRVLKLSGGVLHVHGNVTTKSKVPVPKTFISSSSGTAVGDKDLKETTKSTIYTRTSLTSDIIQHGCPSDCEDVPNKSTSFFSSSSPLSLSKSCKSTICECKSKCDPFELNTINSINASAFPEHSILSHDKNPCTTSNVTEDDTIGEIKTKTENEFSELSPDKNLYPDNASDKSKTKTRTESECIYKCQSQIPDYESSSDLNFLNCYLASKDNYVDSVFNSNKAVASPASISWAFQVAHKILNLANEIKGGRWTAKILHIEKVKSYAPHVDHVVVDLEVRLYR